MPHLRTVASVPAWACLRCGFRTSNTPEHPGPPHRGVSRDQIRGSRPGRTCAPAGPARSHRRRGASLRSTRACARERTTSATRTQGESDSGPAGPRCTRRTATAVSRAARGRSRGRVGRHCTRPLSAATSSPAHGATVIAVRAPASTGAIQALRTRPAGQFHAISMSASPRSASLLAPTTAPRRRMVTPTTTRHPTAASKEIHSAAHTCFCGVHSIATSKSSRGGRDEPPVRVAVDELRGAEPVSADDVRVPAGTLRLTQHHPKRCRRARDVHAYRSTTAAHDRDTRCGRCGRTDLGHLAVLGRHGRVRRSRCEDQPVEQETDILAARRRERVRAGAEGQLGHAVDPGDHTASR